MFKYCNNLHTLNLEFKLTFIQTDQTDEAIVTEMYNILFNNSSIEEIHLAINSDDGIVLNVNVNEICFPPFTPIRTNYGVKQIKDLVRGDMLCTSNGLQPLTKLMKTKVIKTHKFVKFPAHCFTYNCPTIDTYCTPPHPIGINYKKVPALLLVGQVRGVVYEDIECNAYYNIQFDTPEWLTINNMTFSSHHPQHELYSLKEKEYIDSLKYKPCTYKESYDLTCFSKLMRNELISI
jgi:hypothetical protein